MEQEPPPVTVVNPSGTADVLVGDGPRRGWVLGLVLLVVLATGILISTVRDDHAADRAAADALQLSAQDAEQVGRLVRIGLVNDGQSEVRVVSARLTAAGYATERVDAALRPGARVVLSLTDSATCGPEMANDPASSLALRVRTSRGTTVTRSVALSPEAFRVVSHAARQRCGYLPADEAFRFDALSTTVEPGTAVIRVTAGNGSRFSMQLSQLLPIPGLSLTVTPALPLDLPAQAGPTAGVRSLPLRLTLTVRDCTTFLQSFQRTADRHGELVRGWLVQQGATGFEVPVLTFEPASSYRRAVDPTAIASHLLETCPGLPPG